MTRSGLWRITFHLQKASHRFDAPTLILSFPRLGTDVISTNMTNDGGFGAAKRLIHAIYEQGGAGDGLDQNVT
jgi:hypothetical protein